MKILTVTSIYPTPRDPGLGAFVAAQVDSLRRAGLAVDVLFLDVRRDRSALLRGIARVRNRARRYDVVHAHFGYNGVPAVLQRRRPVVLSLCGTDLVNPKIRPLSRWAAHRAQACIVKSDEMRRLLGLPAHIIPNGVDVRRFRPGGREEARRRLGLRPDRRYALFAADPARPEKRFDLASAALALARQRGTPVEPLILHRRPQDEVPIYLNAADLLVLTSSHEGSPNVVKEAMACNLPVVSTDVGDVRRVLGDTTNCVVADPTPEDVARGVTAVLASGARSNGRDRIGPLDSDRVARRLIDIYAHVIAERGRT